MWAIDVQLELIERKQSINLRLTSEYFADLSLQEFAPEIESPKASAWGESVFLIPRKSWK